MSSKVSDKKRKTRSASLTPETTTLPQTGTTEGEFTPLLSPRRRAESVTEGVTSSGNKTPKPKDIPTFHLPSDENKPSKSQSARLKKDKKDKSDKSIFGKRTKSVPADGSLLNLKRRGSNATKVKEPHSPSQSPPRSPRGDRDTKTDKLKIENQDSPHTSPRSRSKHEKSSGSRSKDVSPAVSPHPSPRGDRPQKAVPKKGDKKDEADKKPKSNPKPEDGEKTERTSGERKPKSNPKPEEPERTGGEKKRLKNSDGEKPERTERSDKSDKRTKLAKLEEDRESGPEKAKPGGELGSSNGDGESGKPVKSRTSNHNTGADTDKDKNSRDASSGASALSDSESEESGGEEKLSIGASPKEVSPHLSKNKSASKSDGCESGGEKEVKPKKEAVAPKKLSATARFFGKFSGRTKKPKVGGVKSALGPAHHYVAGTYPELPDKAKTMIHASKLDKTTLTAFWPELLLVLSFITKDSFRAEANTPLVKRSERTPYASELFFEKAMKELIPIPEKDLQKLYRHMEFSAKGGFGRVFSARHCPENEEKEFVAIKRLPHANSKQRRNNHCELSFLMHCTNHPNIVNYKRSYILTGQSPEMWLVTEFMEGGTLDFAIRVHKFRERHICYIAGEVLNGLVHLHKLGFAHRDLKSANVMMSIKGEVKIIDFGLCCDFHAGPRQQSLGSPYWIPPEMLLRQPHHTAVDIWSFGILILELILGHPPNDHSRLACMMRAVMGTTLECIDPRSPNCPGHRSLKDPSKALVKFLTMCLVTDQSKRATAKELAKDPWLKGHLELREGIDRVLQAVFISNSLQLHGIY